MKKQTLATLITLSTLLLFIGCNLDGTDADSDQLVVNSVSQRLILDKLPNGLSGIVTVDGEAVVFKINLDPRVYMIEARLNGMILRVRANAGAGTLQFMGIAEDGGDTTMQPEDRDLLKRAVKLMFSKVDFKTSLAHKTLFRAMSIWSEYPTTLSLNLTVTAEKGRSYSSWCAYVNNGYYVVKHDCDRGSYGSAVTTYVAKFTKTNAQSPHCGAADGTWFWHAKTGWRCTEPNHYDAVGTSSGYYYAQGNCFGRCGGDCGSDTQVTKDCAEHDSCVRFGHATASMYCNDEFVSTTDDWMFAPSC